MDRKERPLHPGEGPEREEGGDIERYPEKEVLMLNDAVLDSRLATSGSLKDIHRKGRKAYLENKSKKVKTIVRTKNREKPEMEKDRGDSKVKRTKR